MKISSSSNNMNDKKANNNDEVREKQSQIEKTVFLVNVHGTTITQVPTVDIIPYA